jgi:Family of unknown function (DUF6580)
MNSSNRSQNSQFVFRTLVVLSVVVFAAVLRIAPHPWNFAPLGAMALFSGAFVRNRWLAIAFPLAALFAGDVFVGLYELMPIVYASFALSVLIGSLLKNNRTVLRIGGATLLGAAQFFLITNFAVWLAFDTFPRTASGLFSCYVAGLPLFGNTLASDALYVTLFFGGFALAERLFPRLQTSRATLSPANR